MNRQQIEAALGTAVSDVAPLSGGCVGQVYLLTLADKRQVVAKVDDHPHSSLAREGFMLRFLAQHSSLPVPAVLYEAEGLLVMAYLPGKAILQRVVRSMRLNYWRRCINLRLRLMVLSKIL